MTEQQFISLYLQDHRTYICCLEIYRYTGTGIYIHTGTYFGSSALRPTVLGADPYF
jgi:hypothetical protein